MRGATGEFSAVSVVCVCRSPRMMRVRSELSLLPTPPPPVPPPGPRLFSALPSRARSPAANLDARLSAGASSGNPPLGSRRSDSMPRTFCACPPPMASSPSWLAAAAAQQRTVTDTLWDLVLAINRKQTTLILVSFRLLPQGNPITRRAFSDHYDYPGGCLAFVGPHENSMGMSQSIHVLRTPRLEGLHPVPYGPATPPIASSGLRAWL
jgi:hypothetical protein